LEFKYFTPFKRICYDYDRYGSGQTSSFIVQGFVFLIANPDSDDLSVRVLDTAKKDGCIGATILRVSDVVAAPNMELASQVIN